MKLISHGAEAKIFLFGDKVSKQRLPKTYRHFTLDNKIRKSRTKKEAKILSKAFDFGINVPKIFVVEKFNLEIEYLKGDRLSDALNGYDLEKKLVVMKLFGEQVAKLHKNDLIHGDLTTSNVIFSEDKVFIIDFGLGFVSKKIEDKAVDLHLIKQALEAKHFKNLEKLFESFLRGYKFDESVMVVKRLDIVGKRGRYKG
jgi:TP53 regulating kinase-like protein